VQLYINPVKKISLPAEGPDLSTETKRYSLELKIKSTTTKNAATAACHFVKNPVELLYSYFVNKNALQEEINGRIQVAFESVLINFWEECDRVKRRLQKAVLLFLYFRTALLKCA